MKRSSGSGCVSASLFSFSCISVSFSAVDFAACELRAATTNEITEASKNGKIAVKMLYSMKLVGAADEYANLSNS